MFHWGLLQTRITQHELVAAVTHVALNKRLGALQESADAEYEIYKRSHQQLWIVVESEVVPVV